MSVDILVDYSTRKAALYCTTEDRAFGPLFNNLTEAEDFIEWLKTSDVPWSVGSHIDGDGTDPRQYRPGDLEEMVNHWRSLQTYVGDA